LKCAIELTNLYLKDNLNKKLFLIDHELRFLDIVQTCKRWINVGKLGDIHHIHILCTYIRTVHPQRAKWWNKLSYGGGITNAMGSHMIDLLRYLTNCEVHSVISSLHRTPGEDSDSNECELDLSDNVANIILKMYRTNVIESFCSRADIVNKEYNSILATIVLTSLSATSQTQISLYGINGTAILDLQGLKLNFVSKDAQSETIYETVLDDEKRKSMLIGTRKCFSYLQTKFQEGIDSMEISNCSTVLDGLSCQIALEKVFKGAKTWEN